MANANLANEVVDIKGKLAAQGLHFSDEALRRIAKWFIDGDVEPIDRPHPHLRLVK